MKKIMFGILFLAAIMISSCTPEMSPKDNQLNIPGPSSGGNDYSNQMRPLIEYTAAMDPKACILSDLESGADLSNNFRSLLYKATELGDSEICNYEYWSTFVEEAGYTCDQFMSRPSVVLSAMGLEDADGNGRIDYFDIYHEEFKCDSCYNGFFSYQVGAEIELEYSTNGFLDVELYNKEYSTIALEDSHVSACMILASSMQEGWDTTANCDLSSFSISPGQTETILTNYDVQALVENAGNNHDELDRLEFIIQMDYNGDGCIDDRLAHIIIMPRDLAKGTKLIGRETNWKAYFQ
jgi:hypothetical protein